MHTFRNDVAPPLQHPPVSLPPSYGAPPTDTEVREASKIMMYYSYDLLWCWTTRISYMLEPVLHLHRVVQYVSRMASRTGAILYVARRPQSEVIAE